MARKYVTMQDILADQELHDKIVSDIQVKYNRSNEYMEGKRQLFAERYSKFTKPSESMTDKIKVHLLMQHLKAFISTYYSEGLTVQISGEEFLDDDFAYMLEVCAKKDYVYMNKRQKDFFHILNIGFYGVSILMRTGYDYVNECIKYDVVSPEYWLPDPDGNLVKGFGYHMFNFSINRWEIDEANINAESVGDKIYYNIDKFQRTLTDAKEVDDKKASDRGLSTSMQSESYQATRVFIEWEGVKYTCDVFNNRSTIGRRERIMPVDEKEKSFPELIPFPVTPVNAFPLINDPCGVGLAELIISFQNAKNRLLNMALRKEEWNAGFRVLLADISKIEDIDLLAERPTDGPIIIPFDGNMGELNGDVVRPVMDGIQADQSTMNLANVLDQEAQINDGYTLSQRGLPFGPETGLGVAKMQQVNSNLIFSLDSECISRGEVAFYKDMRYRGLKERLKQNKVKYARIGNGLASSEAMISQEDIKEHGDPDIVVLSKKEAKESNKQKLDFLLMREPLVMQNPGIPAISKILYQRDIEKYRGIAREETMLRHKRTVDEERAIRYIGMINEYQRAEKSGMDKSKLENLSPKSLFYKGMDLYTYYIYLQKAHDGDLKRKVMGQIEKLMMEEGMNTPQMAAQGGEGEDTQQLQNSIASQLTSNVVQQSGSVNNFPTREDVLA